MAKNFRLPRLYAKMDAGEGTIAIPTEFVQIDSRLRADLLKDWIEKLTEEYQKALDQQRARPMPMAEDVGL